MMETKRNQHGQSTLEFALMLSLVLGLAIFSIQVALTMGYGSYVQYASFMSARAFLSGGIDDAEQLDRARNVLIRTLKKSGGEPGTDRWPLLAKANRQEPDGQVVGATIGRGPALEQQEPTNPDFSWQEGVRYSFRSRIFLDLLGGTPDQEGNGGLLLTSESWLLRDTNFKECEDHMVQEKGGALFDNGC